MSRKKKQLPLLENITITDVAAEGKARVIVKVELYALFNIAITEKSLFVLILVFVADANGKYFLTKTSLKPSINKYTTNFLVLEKSNFQSSITF